MNPYSLLRYTSGRKSAIISWLSALLLGAMTIASVRVQAQKPTTPGRRIEFDRDIAPYL